MTGGGGVGLSYAKSCRTKINIASPTFKYSSTSMPAPMTTVKSWSNRTRFLSATLRSGVQVTRSDTYQRSEGEERGKWGGEEEEEEEEEDDEGGGEGDEEIQREEHWEWSKLKLHFWDEREAKMGHDTYFLKFFFSFKDQKSHKKTYTTP